MEKKKEKVQVQGALSMEEWIRNLLFVLAGNTLYALAVTMFILPSGMIAGGTTGLALVFYHQLGIPIEAFVSVFNVVTFIMGAVVLGRKFALTTVVSTFYYPFILSVFQGIPALGNMTEDMMLSVIFAGLLVGAGIGIVLRVGASTGGMDIPPLILHKKLGVPISVTMNVLDISILLLQMLFSDQEAVLYGILQVLIYTTILNRVLLMGNSRMQVKIISRQYEAINEAIAMRLDRGATLLKARTGYLKEDGFVVMTVINSRELAHLNRLIQEIDPKAFIIINQVNEVRGRGFTLQKKDA